MKILQVIDLFGAAHGGAAEVPFQLSKELARRGHQVTVYTSDVKLEPDRVTSIPGVDVRVFKTWVGLANFYLTPAIMQKASEEISRFEVIHLHQYRSFQNLVVSRYARKYNVPYVLQAHGSLLRGGPRGSLKRVADSLWGYGLLKGAAAVLAVTEFEAERYRDMGVSPDRIKIVPHGIDITEFDRLPRRGAFRETYGLQGKKVILYLGRINRIKGLDLLTRAFAALPASIQDTALVFVGPDDGYLGMLKHLVKELGIEEKVILPGPLYGRDKLEAYMDADVYVLPSSYEIFGITILEALACGTPALITDRCGLAPAVDGQGALVVPFEEARLREVLQKMLQNNRLRRELGEKGKALVRRDYTWQKIAGEVEGIYAFIMSGVV